MNQRNFGMGNGPGSENGGAKRIEAIAVLLAFLSRMRAHCHWRRACCGSGGAWVLGVALLGSLCQASRSGPVLRPSLLRLRLRGGLEDVEPLELGLDERDIERLHCQVGRDGGARPSPFDYASREGNVPFYDEDANLDEQGASDGFPSNWTRWAPDARFHLGFRAPRTLALNHSIYATFDDGVLVAVRRVDGTQRFAQVLKRKSEGELQVGHQYEPTAPGCLPSARENFRRRGVG